MRKSVSVAMAVYNGEKYLKQQLDSILPQLTESDEIVISLDPSMDNSKLILDSYQDKRITIIDGPGKGVISNFENAIQHTQNEIIFLCDQDDVWNLEKVEKVLSAFDNNVKVVMHDAKIVDENLNIIENSYFSFRKSKLGILHNVLKNSYIGCCMAFTKELKEYILPFPDHLPMHDQWIGLVGEIKGKNILLENQLMLYRRHKDNVSNIEHSNLSQMIKWRISIIKALLSIKKVK